MSTIAIDAEYVDSGDEESEESVVDELWNSPAASDSDRCSVFLPSPPPSLEFPSRKGKQELTPTEKQSRWAVKAFRDFCQSEGLSGQFEDASVAELNDLLKSFYTNARRKDGMEFSKAGFVNIRVGLDRYFKISLQKGFSIIRNADFEESNKAYEAKLVRLDMAGANPWRRPCSISPVDIEKLLSSGVFSSLDPLNLLRACWFNVSLHFNFGDHLKQRKLSKFQFLFKTNSAGIEYVKFAGTPESRGHLMKSSSQEDEKTAIMYSVPHHPLCPVKLLRKYLQKLHPNFDSLYQCPVPYSVDDRVPIWYEKQSIGVHQLEGMMGRISKDAQLSRVYTNACLKATSPLVYLSCGFGANVQSQSLQQGRVHHDVGVTDVSSTPSKTPALNVPGSSSTHGASSAGSKASMFSLASISNSFSRPEDHGAILVSEGRLSTSSWSPSSLAEACQDSPGVGCTDPVDSVISGTSALNMPIKIESVCSGIDVSLVSSACTDQQRPSTTAECVTPGNEGPTNVMHPPPVNATASEDNSRLLVHGRSYLRLQVTDGKLFVDPDVTFNAPQEERKPASTMMLHVHFMHQRVQSRPVKCAYELPIKEDFYLEFADIKTSDVSALLSIPDKVHLVLITTDPVGNTSLVSSQYLDWQRVLSVEDGRLASSVELNGVGAEAKMMVGVLEVKLEIVPKMSKAITPDELRSHLSLTQCRVSERDRQFMSYARHWWRELMTSSASHGSRSVKIFTQDECGASRPVVSYVRPLQVGWVLDTPREAAQFVSLLGFEEEASMWGGRTEMWSSLHVFLGRGKGGCEDHAALLCSLLLGFGMNAFVCCGTKLKGTPHVWVMTQQQTGHVSFWESLTGKRFNLASKTYITENRYKTIGCVFNHKSFYANIQSSDSVSSCSFDLDNPSLWKAMSEERIQAFCGEDISPPLPSFPPLLAPVVHSGIASQKLEEEMKEIICHHRTSLGLSTNWDCKISYRLGPALHKQNEEDLDEVKEAVARVVPPGFSFVTRAHSFKHRNARQAVDHMIKLPECESLIFGDGVTLALRVRVVLYPENTCVAWVMFAGLYRSTEGAVKFEWNDR